jgi:tetratricopeptide (TPR) repeat protein
MKKGLKWFTMFTILTTMSYSNVESWENIPDGPGDLYRTAQIEIAAKKYDSAIENTKKIVKIAPKDADVRVEMARLYNSAEQTENSYNEYEVSINIENNEEIIFEYGNLCFKNKEFEKATEVFLKDKSGNYKNEFGAAASARLAGNLEKSEKYYKKVIEKNPELADAYFGLGVIYQKQKSYDSAIENFKNYLERKKNEDVYTILSSLYMLKKDYTNAKEIIKTGLKDYPNSEKLKKLLQIASVKKK